MEDKGNKAKKCSSSAEKDEINEVENNSSTKLDDVENILKEIQTNYGIVQQSSPRPSTENRIFFCVDVNDEAYTPKVVIIGPLRYYRRIFEHVEMQKRKYLDSFLQRAKKNKKKASLNHFITLIKDSADDIHDCYEKTYLRRWDFCSHAVEQVEKVNDGRSGLFIEMILVDACFIIELFLKAYKLEGGETDFIFNTPGKMHEIRRDLFLAHNQLPFFILKKIYKRAFEGNPDYPSFIHLTCYFFSPYYNQNKSIEAIMQLNHSYEYIKKLKKAKHFTDLLRILQIPYSFQKDCSKEKSLCRKLQIQWIKTKVVHLVDQRRSTLQPSSKKPEESLEAGKVQGEYLYSAVLLRDAGVKFKVSKSLLDIDFNKKNGELKIPPLKVDESTESFFRNLMAWEQHYYSHDTYICDYIFLMEYLIKSTEDVDLLIRRRIIINQLGSNTAVATLFNKFCKHVCRVKKNRYSDIFRKLNAYNAVRHHSWIAILRLQYFSTLWSGVATIAAVVLLVLTLIQAICAVISLLLEIISV